MKNNTKLLFQIIKTSLQNEANGYDDLIAESEFNADLLPTAKLKASYSIDKTIMELLELKDNLQGMPIDLLEKKYSQK